MFTTLASTGPVLDLGEALDRMFDEMECCLPTGAQRRTRFEPSVNIGEDDEGFFIEADLPGLKMDDIDVTVDGRELTISGERRAAETSGRIYRRRESPAGRFQRLFALPATADAAGVRASLAEGVLTVEIPKTASAKPRRVEVRSE